MYKIAGIIACVSRFSKSCGRTPLKYFGDHSDVMARVKQVTVGLNSVQEALDMGAIALSYFRGQVPFLHFFDGFEQVMK